VVAVALAGVTCGPAYAGDPADVGGALSSALHLGLDGCGPSTVGDCRFLDFQDLVVLDAHAEGDLGDAVTWHVSGALRLHPLHGVTTVEQSRQGNLIQPYSIDLNEAWVGLDDVIGDGVDLRLGQQRFAWGTGLGVHPTDVASPIDLRDPTRFDQRLGVPAILARAHRGKVALDLVYTPLFRPARMPAEIDLIANAEDLFDFSASGGEGVDVGSFETRTTLPDGRIGFAGAGGRFTLATRAADLSLMAWRGIDSLPQAGGTARIVGFQTNSDRVDIGVPLLYPTLTVVGGDLRAPLPGDVGFWVEGALILPTRTTVTASRGQLDALVRIGTLDAVPDPLPETVIQDGKPYPRVVAGLDRTFGRVALAGQWIHGLPTERSAADLGDYVAVVAGLSLSDVTRLSLQALSDFQGVLVGADLSVLHRDAATLHVGATVTRAPSGSALGDLQALSNITTSVDVAF